MSEESGYASSFRFLWEQRESGSYYFTIQNRGDEITYRSSEPAQSPVWTYEAPMRKIDAPIRPTWGVRRFATITPVESEYLMGYRAQWFFIRDTQDENAEELAVGNMMQFHPNSVEFRVPDSLLTQYGSGYYAVRICALSDDIRGMSVSDWSALSRYSAFSAGNRTVADIVATVSEKSLPEDIQRAIENLRDLDTKAIADAMATDLNNTETAGQIAKMEAIAGNHSVVSVSEELADVFDAGLATIIGASLNLDLGGTAVLNIEPAAEDQVLSTLYGNVLQFSMSLTDTNGKSLTPNGEDLEIPAKVTLPIPETINPQFLIILHRHADGTCERISTPYIRRVRDQWYATFVLHNFSDFTMAELTEDVQACYAAEGISLTYRIRNADVRSVFCALYDEAGRLIRTAALPRFEERNTFLVHSSERCATVRIFTLDEFCKPVGEALIPVIETADG